MAIIRIVVVCAGLLLGTLVTTGEKPVFTPDTILGKWEGKGRARMPVTGLKISIKGNADFSRDSTDGHIRSEMSGHRLFFSYSDSGHLYIDPDSDSLVWEIWDGFGKHITYHGTHSDGAISATAFHDNKIHQMAIGFVTADSVTFRLTTINHDDTTENVFLDLWRSE